MKLRKLYYIIVLFVVVGLLLMNYTTIITSIISRFQCRENIPVMYVGEFEPKEKIADITIAALDSMFSADSLISAKEHYKRFKYVAVDAKKMPHISDKEVQHILAYFKGYNDKTIYASREELKKLGLCTLRTKDLRGGILLSIDEVIELTNEKAVLKIFWHESGLGAAGYICTLVYKDDKWQVESLVLKYMA